MTTNIEELLKSIRQATELLKPIVQDKLAKADDKDEDDLPPPPADGEKPEGDLPPPPAEGEKPEGDLPPPAEGEQPEQKEGEQPEQQEESYEEMFAQLEPSQLQEIIDAAQKVLSAKAQPDQPPAGQPPAQPPVAQPPVSPEMESMRKSNDLLLAKIEELAKSIADLKAKPQVSKPASKPAAVSTKVETMQKSEQQPEMLAKSDIQEFLISQQLGGKKIPTSLVHDTMHADTPAKLREVYHKASVAGVTIPYKQ